MGWAVYRFASGDARMTGMDRKDAKSFGKTCVGFDFNPSGDQQVANIKGLFAEIIDAINDMPTRDDMHDHLKEQAVLQSITAQMWAIKAATWQPK